MPIISVIVPVYKVEKYLERCVSSLINQSLKDMEIILVDDGSPDQSGALCERLQEMDERILVIHKKNGGLSSARNAGMKIACGKYIGFVDSDDDVELDMFQTMIEAAELNNADFVMADYIRFTQEGNATLVSTNLKDGNYLKEDIIKNIYPSLVMGKNIDYGPILAVWHCIYNRSFLIANNITFAEDVKWSEDNLFSAMVGYCANRFVYLKGKGLYHYYQNPGTITTSYREGAWDIYKRMNEYMTNYFGAKKEYDFEYQLKLHLIYYECNVIRLECQHAQNMRSARVNVKKILRDVTLSNCFKNFKIPVNISAKLYLQLLLMKYKLAGLLVLCIRG